MKNPILSLTALCGMAVILTSCDSRAKLSDSVQGIWAGTPQQMTDTGAAKATVTGLRNLDTSSLTVNVDPEAVQLNYNVLTTGSQSQLVALKPAASVLATQQITRAAQSAFFNLREIEDIKIHGSIMTCEFGHQDFTFSRQEESRP